MNITTLNDAFQQSKKAMRLEYDFSQPRQVVQQQEQRQMCQLTDQVQQQQQQQHPVSGGYRRSFSWGDIVGNRRIVGLLFCNPSTELAKKQILPLFEYFDHRSGSDIDIYWAGYGNTWDPALKSERFPVPELARNGWEFSAKVFNDLRHELESKTNWHYSGDTDLVLTTIVVDPNFRGPKLDLDETMVLTLERLLETKAISSVPSCFEELFRFSADKTGQTSVLEYSDRMLIRNSKKGVLKWVLGRLKLGEFFDQTAPFAIRSITKREA